LREIDNGRERDAAGAGADWHLAWASAAALAALAATALGAEPRLAWAFAAAGAPGLVAQLARLWRGGILRTALALSWATATCWAVWSTGGLAGPLACLSMAPAAAFASFGERRLLALGAALTGAGLAALAVTAGTGPPAAEGGPLLTAAVVLATALGVAAALQMAGARSARREAASAAEAAELRRLLEASPVRTLRVGEEGRILCGLGAEGAAGLEGEPLETIADVADRAAVRAALELARRTGASSLGVRPPLAPDRFLAVELRAPATGLVAAFVRDASLEHAIAAALERRASDAEEEAAAKSRFLANMSHELRTPLNAIIGFSDIMRSRLFGPLPARYAEYAGLIHESGGHLLDLINDVLDFSKIEAERFTLSRERFDARDAVAAALRLTRVQADSARIDLRAALPAEAIRIDADRRAIKQIVLNLVSNALKFTPPGGQVNIVARAVGPNLELIVADTGVGIAPRDLERLGRPFEQAGPAEQRARGTGLGLSLVRAFAELHGGAMTLESALGDGTVATVRMPVIDRKAPERPDAAPASNEAPASAEEPLVAAALGDNVIVFNPHR